MEEKEGGDKERVEIRGRKARKGERGWTQMVERESGHYVLSPENTPKTESRGTFSVPVSSTSTAAMSPSMSLS